ncbi:hypothetical protein K9M79_07430 [Candidatus Woesearchaeota archaeon]|nr:hypothetical protein [Candidatus Woesearchaeota archaeon]
MRINFIIFVLVFIILSPIVFSEISLEQEQIIAEKISQFSEPDMIIIMGNDVSTSERVAFNIFKEKYPQISHLDVYNDTDAPDKNAFLIGGKKQNSVTRTVLESSTTNLVERNNLSLGYVTFLTSGQKKYIVMQSRTSDDNLIKTSYINSPLSRYMPKEVVPLAATAIGISLVWLWNLLFTLGRKVLRLALSGKIMKYIKKKKFTNEYKGFKIMGIPFRYREWISILLAALVFALITAYSYYSGLTDLAELLTINIIVNFIIYSMRNIIRLIFDKIYNIKTEYVFWIWGAVVTVISGWLGNTFSLAGYNVSESEKDAVTDAKIQYGINVLSFLVALGLAIWNIILPSILLQMSMTLALSIAVIQMMPISPFSGKGIYKWNRKIWWLSFIPMLVTYVLANI